MRKILPLILITVSVLACNRANKHADKFYTETSDWDMIRFPLIKPYEVVTLPPDTSWSIEVTDLAHTPPNIQGTRSININDSLIFAYAKNTLLIGQQVNEAWFVITAKTDSVRGFTNRQEYLEYLKSIKVKSPKLYPVRDVFNRFYDRDTLDWKDFNRQH